MLPEHLIAEFWSKVNAELKKKYELRAAASRAISSYRSIMDQHQVGDMVYHRDPESVAETIALGWKNGVFPDAVGEAPPTRKARRAVTRQANSDTRKARAPKKSRVSNKRRSSRP